MKQKTLQQKAKAFDIEEHIVDIDISYRGGTLKVNVAELFPNVEEPIMGAYQNYLGGGLAGCIVDAAMFHPDDLPDESHREAFHILRDRIKRYFYEANQGGGDEYMVANNSYKANQSLPASYPGL